ncbi:MAG: phosphatidate cytidylyltransferase [Candidatus Eisenbacteria bacterium]|uniref:Phosphatidate cytidylyltransferase n=1 Tax=Eiseniibacteriota bacterium TaxID=2212470 RepID=A0A956M131_UNCEI|nr:phosphatidate cytidylyltransferase [Candidatus Eisenbacteria bacterium]
MTGSLGRRALTVLLLGPVFLGLVLAGPTVFASGLAILVGLAAWELHRILKKLGYGTVPVLPVLAVAVYVANLAGVLGPGETTLVAVGWGSALGVLYIPPSVRRTRSGLAVGVAQLCAAAYLGILPSFLVRLYESGFRGTAPPGTGADWLFLAVFLIWACDTGAYVVGSLWGRHHLWPAVSPKKTWEGWVGGAVAAITAAVGLGGVLQSGLAMPAAVGLGFCVAVVAALGDLVESRLKRSASLKDSGSLLPGHGGVLDRFDSLFFAAPLFYYYLSAFGR